MGVSSTENFLPTVTQATEQALCRWGPHILFEQVRLAPERLIVHFIGYELQSTLDAHAPGCYYVAFEKCGRADLSIFQIATNKPMLVIELKVPWSGWTDRSAYESIVRDFEKLGRCEVPGIFIAAFLDVKRAPSWSDRDRTGLKALEWRDEIQTLVGGVRPDAMATVSLDGDETEMECTLMLWNVVRNQNEVQW